jgi:hypothetical protein
MLRLERAVAAPQMGQDIPLTGWSRAAARRAFFSSQTDAGSTLFAMRLPASG